MYRAYGNRIMVDISGSTKASNRIQLPEGTAVDRYIDGEIVSVGPGVMTPFGWDGPRVSVGDKVVFDRSHAVKTKLFGEDVLAIYMGDVIGVDSEDELPRHESSGLLVESA